MPRRVGAAERWRTCAGQTSEVYSQRLHTVTGACHVRSRVVHDTIFTGGGLAGGGSPAARTNHSIGTFGALQVHVRINPGRSLAIHGISRWTCSYTAAAHDSDLDAELRGSGGCLCLWVLEEKNDCKQTQEPAREP